MIGALVVACVSFAAWLFLLAARGGYWRASPSLDADDVRRPASDRFPSVLAVIPARNEADVLGETLPTVLGQRYDGPFRAVLVDDDSSDATAAVAQNVAAHCQAADRLEVIAGRPLPNGWAGKVWAMYQGVERADDPVDFFWLTDADIAHDPNVLQALVEKATGDSRDLVSLMAALRVGRGWDALLIPAFVYFFSKLYPFRWVGDPRRKTAGAAGGCMLVRQASLAAAGGLEAIRSALIDDCALGSLIKRVGGRTWLGFTNSVRSVRSYQSLRSIWDMVARSAFHQLRYSILLLLGTVLGMLLLYAVPPAALIAGLVLLARSTPGALPLTAVGAVTWGALAVSFVPILGHLHSRRWVAPLLPIAGVLYTAMTVSSAIRHWTGRGGLWKGRPFAAE